MQPEHPPSPSDHAHTLYSRSLASLPTLPARLRFMLRQAMRPRAPRRLPMRRAALLVSVLIAVGAGVGAGIWTLAQMKPVTVVIDGNAYPARVRAETVGGLLREVGIAINANDRVMPAPQTTVTADMIVRVDRARAVTLVIDGQMRAFWTADTNPAEILANAGIVVAADDRVTLDGTHSQFDDLARWPVPVGAIQVRHAVTVRLDDDGRQTRFMTTADTVGEALFEAGIVLYLADRVSPDVSTPLPAQIDTLHVQIERAIPVTIHADGMISSTRTRAAGVTTVADALASATIALIGLDYTVPDESAPLHAGMTIRVVRVREETLLEEQTVPFATRYQPNSALPAGTRFVFREGETGLQTVRRRIRYEDGVPTEQTIDAVLLTRPPQDQIVLYGTSAARSGLERINP